MKAVNIMFAVMGAILRVVVVVVLIFMIFRGTEICYDYGYRIFTEPAISVGDGRVVTVSITEDMSPWKIGELLESRGLVRDSKLFALQYYLSEYLKDVRPGTFELNTNMTAEEMMAVMAQGAGDEEEDEEDE